MKPELDSSVPQQEETALMGEAHLNIKPEGPILPSSTSLASEEQKLNSAAALNCSQQQQSLDVKTATSPIPQSLPQHMASVMHGTNLMSASLHSLHQASSVPQLPNPGSVSAAHQHVSAGVDSNSCGLPEFELARRLGVRFDSSNAAWVARWTDAQNDRKKSRWFSVAKYGNAPARRLAIQACLHNMKPSDFPSLRDLQDVLATFGHPGGPTAPGGYLVPGADMSGMGSANMAGVVRSSGVDPHHMAGKLGAQFGSHQFFNPHHNPFAAMSGMPNPMAGYAMAAGGLPGMGMHPSPNMGMFVQGVPQQLATQGVAPQTTDILPVQEGETGGAEGLLDQHQVGANGQSIVKSQSSSYQQGGDGGLLPMDPNLTQQPIKQFDQTTTAASSVSSPSATAGVKLEDAQQAVAGSLLHTIGPSGHGSDAAFLQSLSAHPPPSTTPESASSSRFVLSGDSSSQESSDLDTRSIASDEDDDDDDNEGKDDDEEGGERTKRKKRKLDENGNAENTGNVQSAPNGFGQQMYNGQQSQQQTQAGSPQQSLQVMAGQQQASNYPSYYASLYGGYAGAQQQMLMHQMNGQAGGQPGMHSLPFFLQPQMLPMLHPHFQQHAAAAAAAGFLPHGSLAAMDQSQYHHLLKSSQGLYLPQGYGQQGAEDSPQSPSGDSPSSVTSPNGDMSGAYKRHHHGHSGSQSSSSSGGGAQQASAKMTCERGLHYTKCYRGNQECWIAVWNTKGGRIMHEAFDVADLGYEAAKQKAREARDAAHSNNVAVTENSRPSWKSHSNTGIPHVSLDSQQLRFRAHKFGRRLCRSFSFGRRRGSYASRESAFDAAVLWLIQTPTEEEIAAVSGCNSKIEDI